MSLKSISRLLTLCLLFPSLSYAWTISNFEVNADIQTDGSVEITETITADFGENSYKHGISRDIPFRYKDENEKSFKTPIKQISVTDENGAARNFTTSTKGSDKSLKIGRAEVFVDAQEVYVIKYTVTGVLNQFEDHDEFYWNVTGNGWDTAIEKAAITINLPKSSTVFKNDCFTGREGSTQKNCTVVQSDSKKSLTVNNRATSLAKTPNNSVSASVDTINDRFCDEANPAIAESCKELKQLIKTPEDFNQRPHTLKAYEGLTVVFGFDKNLVDIPKRHYDFDFELWAKRLQFLFLLLPLWAVNRVIRKRKEAEPLKPVITRYHPPEDLSIAQLGFLYQQKTTPKHLAALITQLGVKGAIKIEEEGARKSKYGNTKFTLTPLITSKKQRDTLSHEALYVYHHLFYATPPKPVVLREIAAKKQSIFSYLHFFQLGRITKTKCSQYLPNYSLGLKRLLIFVTSFMFGFPLLIAISGLAKSLIPLFAVGVAFVALFFTPKFNRSGNEKLNEIKGYYQFLEAADKDRINWSEAQNIFEKNLPYAVALGLTDKWARVFGDKIQMPDWYQSTEDGYNFNHLERRLNTISSQAITSAARAHHRATSSSRGSSGFSSSGSSGGGFGGGGGSSW